MSFYEDKVPPRLIDRVMRQGRLAAYRSRVGPRHDVTLCSIPEARRALEEMRRASQLAPEDAGIRADLGLALELAGKIPEAMEQLHEALRMNPNSAEAHSNLGLALLASGKARESIPEFEVALRLKPELKGAADNLRRAQAQLGSQR